MGMKQKFKLFKERAELPDYLERALNEWAAALPAGSRIRRTQVTAVAHPVKPGLYEQSVDTSYVVALVNYEEPDGT